MPLLRLLLIVGTLVGGGHDDRLRGLAGLRQPLLKLHLVRPDLIYYPLPREVVV